MVLGCNVKLGVLNVGYRSGVCDVDNLRLNSIQLPYVRTHMGILLIRCHNSDLELDGEH